MLTAAGVLTKADHIQPLNRYAKLHCNPDHIRMPALQ